MRPTVIGLISGLLFGSGLVISGMSNAEHVLAFLHIGNGWSPNLLVVMAAAIGVHGGLVVLFNRSVSIPPITRRRVDAQLIAGAALFGLGWGLAGYCPGPALVAAAAAVPDALWFTSWMLGGMVLFQVLHRTVSIPGSEINRRNES